MVYELVTPPKVRCREITTDLLPAAEKMLNEGFPERSRAFWARAIGRLAKRRVPEGYPRFGFLLMNGDSPAGCILTIFSSSPGAGGPVVRCNFSAYYTQSPFRAYASMLTSRAFRFKEVTFLNISPRANTLPLVEAQGYKRYSDGSLIVAAWRLPAMPQLNIERFDPAAEATPGLTANEHDILADHAGFGCLSLVCRSGAGASPLVLQYRRVIKRIVPVAHVIYCRSMDDFVPMAGSIGRYLAKRGAPLMLIDTDGSIPPLTGRRLNLPKFFKGPARPRLGDLSYTELPILGI
jgi:hypothetical protein